MEGRCGKRGQLTLPPFQGVAKAALFDALHFWPSSFCPGRLSVLVVRGKLRKSGSRCEKCEKQGKLQMQGRGSQGRGSRGAAGEKSHVSKLAQPQGDLVQQLVAAGPSFRLKKAPQSSTGATLVGPPHHRCASAPRFLQPTQWFLTGGACAPEHTWQYLDIVLAGVT